MALIRERQTTIVAGALLDEFSDAERNLYVEKTKNIVDRALREAADAAWRWYHEHEQDVLIKKTVLFLHLTVRTRDVRFLFVLLFDEPQI